MSEIQDQVEELKKLQMQINELSETAEEKGIDCSDIDPEVLNFLDYEERFEIFLDIYSRWQSGESMTVNDIDIAGLSGVDDESDLEVDPDDEINEEFISTCIDDFEYYFDDSLNAFQNCIDN